jgi:hypothetical protein
LTRIDAEAIDQRLGLWIGLWIEPLMRMPVAAEKALKAKHVAVLGAADDNRSAGAGLKQPHATQNQRAHDPLAKLRLHDQQCPELVGRDDQRLDRFFRMGVNQSRSPRQLRQLAHECARPMSNDRGATARFIVLSDVDIATQDDGKSETHLADRR